MGSKTAHTFCARSVKGKEETLQIAQATETFESERLADQ